MAVGQKSDTDVLLAYNVLRTATALNPHIDRGLQELNLTGSQLNALMVLKDAGPEGISLGEIGRSLVVTKANVTGLIDRLERDGLVERRVPSGRHADRRVTLAALTKRGAELLAEALPRHGDSLSGLLSFLTDDEKSQLVELLTKLRRGLRESNKEGAS